MQLIDAGTDRQIWSKTYDRTLNGAIARDPQFALAYTGSTTEMRMAIDGWRGNQPLSQIAAYPPAVRYSYELLRYEQRYAELSRLLQLVPATPVPYGEVSNDYEIYDIGEIGTVPDGVRYRGWTALLRFVRTRTTTPRTEFFLRRLEAEGELFSGRAEQAIRSASASLVLVPRTSNATAWIGVAMMAARIDAWAGAPTQADELLKQLAVANPGLPPAIITRDPLFAVPLAHDAEYQSLSRLLEAQMTALNLH